MPGTLTGRLAGEACTRLQELARPGREAPELLQTVIERLRELYLENAAMLVACRTGRPATSPPSPRVRWESDES